MEYIYLIIQIILTVLTPLYKTNDRFLGGDNQCYKRFMMLEITVQIICVVTNITFLFIIKNAMIYVLISHIVLMGLILEYYSIKATIKYFKRLKDFIIKNNMDSEESNAIRLYLLKNYGEVHFIDDIERCLKYIRKNNKI